MKVEYVQWFKISYRRNKYITKCGKVRNEEIRKQTKQETIITKIDKKQL